MLVPEFWAEATAKYLKRGNQVTIRRFGWSNESQQDAENLAESRAQDALLRVLAGEKLLRREPKVPYNGAEGVPIREEIVARHGDAVVTRNMYGARCLNTPNVLFADIDFCSGPPARFVKWTMATLFLAGVGLGWQSGGFKFAFLSGLIALLIGYTVAQTLYRIWLGLVGGAEGQARRRVEAFIASHPDWHLRLYRSPAGFRALAMHRAFDPAEPAVTECFQQLGTDPIYMRMCLRQNCFRARVSPKPWRIGIAEHIKPRPGYWPVKPERLPERARWIEDYERRATGFASCRFVAALGSGKVDRDVDYIRAVHDELCRSESGLPLA